MPMRGLWHFLRPMILPEGTAQRMRQAMAEFALAWTAPRLVEVAFRSGTVGARPDGVCAEFEAAMRGGLVPET